MADIEILEFSIPVSGGQILYLSDITASLGLQELQGKLLDAFSAYGLIYQVVVKGSEEGSTVYYSYVKFYSVRAAAQARAALQRGNISIKGCQTLKVGSSPRGRPASLPLPRFKCEELANFYLGFSGWRSEILYHRREESDPTIVKYVSVVRLEFAGAGGLCCEGAGLVEQFIDEGESYGSVIPSTAKRCLGEAFIAAWAKVLLVVVGGDRVQVQVNTLKKDAFFYNPLWGEPEVVVNEVDYSEQEGEEEEETDLQEGGDEAQCSDQQREALLQSVYT